MSDPRDPFDPSDSPDDRADGDPDATSSWPRRDLDEESGEADVTGSSADPRGGPYPATGSGQVSTDWDPRRDGDRRRPTTAEEAVPWLIGLILALSGIVIVLLALIFTDANGGFGATSSSSPTEAAVASASPSGSSAASPSATATASAAASATAKPAPKYGALEMLYLSRLSPNAVSQLYRRDFATSAAAKTVASSASDVMHYALAPDGTTGAAIVGGKLLLVAPGKATRILASGVAAATFGIDASTVYAVQIVRSGAIYSDATVLAIAVADGGSKKLTTITYPHGSPPAQTAVRAARAFDDGGSTRIYATTDGNLVLWVDGAGQWRVDPVSGDDVAVARPPVLWSPDGMRRVALTESGDQTTLSLVNQSGSPSASVFVSGLISHLRWSPTGSVVVFTVARPTSSGGIHQDLYLWDLVDKKSPRELSTNGATYGAEFLGSPETWQP